MRPGRAAVAVIVSGTVVAYLGWNVSHEVESQERVVGAATAHAAKYSVVDMRGDAAMRRTMQRMIIR